MPTYVAIGRDTSGAQRKERISAETPNEARNLLKDQGLYVMDIKEESGFNIDLESIKTSMTKVTVKDKAIFSPSVCCSS
jgi:type IV pilus assembly protein PilC